MPSYLIKYYVGFFTDLSDTNAESDDCIQHCPQLLRPICGSNGQTFGNLCEMKVAMCKDKNKTLTMLHEGSCDDHVSLKIFIKKLQLRQAVINTLKTKFNILSSTLKKNL